jgi:outer membrane protein assembly factor BamB
MRSLSLPLLLWLGLFPHDAQQQLQSSSWPMFGGGATHPRAAGPTALLCAQAPPSASLLLASPGGPAEPAVAGDGSIIFCGLDGAVQRLGGGGLVQWRYAGIPGGCHASPLLTAVSAIVATFSGFVQALDLDTGAVQWTLRAGAACFSSPVITPEGLLVIACDQAGGSFRVLGLDSRTGAQVWISGFGPNFPSAAVASSPLLMPSGLLFFATTAGQVFTLRCADGALAFSNVLPAVFESSATLTPDGQLLVLGYQDPANASAGGVLALGTDAELTPAWTLPLGAAVTASPAFSPAAGLFFVNANCPGGRPALPGGACSAPTLFAVDAQGTVAWSERTGGGYSSPVVADGDGASSGGLVFVGSDPSSLLALHQLNGSLAWAVELAGGAGGRGGLDSGVQSPAAAAAAGGALLVVARVTLVAGAAVQVQGAQWGANCPGANASAGNVGASTAALCSANPAAADACFVRAPCAGALPPCLPDPAPDCLKDLAVNFSCAGEGRRALLPRADEGDWLWLSCRDQGDAGLYVIEGAAAASGSASASASATASASAAASASASASAYPSSSPSCSTPPSAAAKGQQGGVALALGAAGLGLGAVSAAAVLAMWARGWAGGGSGSGGLARAAGSSSTSALLGEVEYSVN